MLCGSVLVRTIANLHEISWPLTSHQVYVSPQVDMGYDIADYRAIHPPYGSLSDVENLIEGLHKRGIKLVMDLVVNHTSDQVPNLLK